jgi:hypothetical protein
LNVAVHTIGGNGDLLCSLLSGSLFADCVGGNARVGLPFFTGSISSDDTTPLPLLWPLIYSLPMVMTKET